ncbi:MAG TPA: hypothetical protein D7H87_07615, partial [Candidatus Poseidoniales archaeon]
GGLVLYIGTERGMMTLESATGRDDATPSWRFFFDPNPSDIPNKIDDLRTLNLGASGNPAEVQALKLDGPNAQNPTVLWIGTPSGLHQLDLQLNDMSFGGLLEHPGNDADELAKSNNIHSVYPTGDEILVGSSAGLWVLAGNYVDYYGVQSNSELPGEIASIATIERDNATYVLGAASPGRFANLELMDPGANDSDSDGMPDGWELSYGLDPTDPWDALLDGDVDGLRLDGGDVMDRWWTNLEEYRYVARTEEGYNSTLPNQSDSDMDGLLDGSEFFGYFLGETNFDCYYNPQLVYICDEALGQQARTTYTSLNSVDVGTDPTVMDTDGDGMPDGWEIEHRRWVGTSFNGGNNWSLDPTRADDAAWDADQDGLANLCEYQWSLVREAGLNGDLFEDFGETAESVATWSIPDPNLIDSDGDTLPDGWEADGQCTWSPLRVGVNPLNGSDLFENPDGDGYDVNKDGVLSQNEMFVNYLEYHIRSGLFLNNQTFDGTELPNGFVTDLFDNVSDFGTPEADFASRASGAILAGQIPVEKGSTDPFSADSDDDGMPDGWEIYHSRWSLFEVDWTLNPVNSGDGLGDPDFDGMSNWEEYNSINSVLSETDNTISSPQFYLTDAVGSLVTSPWIGAESALSFGHFVSQEQFNRSGGTGNPNNPDTDGDGLLDGVEVIFTSWNDSDEVWTLNPLVPNDGNYDSDSDGIMDITELNLTSNLPINGESFPSGAPTFGEESRDISNLAFQNRIYRILFSKEGRAELAMEQYWDWREGSPARPMLQSIFGITDPKSPDTDRDGMSDGYEYWFTEWDLEENIWTMNPLTDTDVEKDSDDDSFDCDGDGEISDSESFDNLAEYDSRTYGKRLEVGNFPNSSSIISYGEDTVIAFVEEEGMDVQSAWDEIYTIFSTKSLSSSDKVGLINQHDYDNFNKSLIGISDPTDSDSDRDGMPDGWEYCYSIYSEILPVNSMRWSLNPLNPLDVNYDPDADGWLDRQVLDSPAIQGVWEDREFFPYPQDQQFGNEAQSLYFTNLMEFHNGTGPLDPDSDSDSIIMTPVFHDGVIVDYIQDMSLSDGREIFKFGTNPLDNDTDGDMMPDFYEYYRGWNETNDNWTSLMHISVIWHQVTSVVWKPVQVSNGVISRPALDWAWFTHDPTDPTDAGQDADNDGSWDCSGGSCVYQPFNNFQEYYGVVNASMSSPSLIRDSSILDCAGNQVSEWWQLRESLLGTCSGSSAISTNYFRMNKINDNDMLYALVIQDNDL